MAGVGSLTPSLAQLCPDPDLRRQLLAVYEVRVFPPI
jgi:hypothetical protein